MLKIEKINIGGDEYHFRRVNGWVYAPFGSWQFPMSNEVYPNDKAFDEMVDEYISENDFLTKTDEELIKEEESI